MIIEPDIWRRIKVQIVERREREAEKIVMGGCRGNGTAESVAMSYADHVGLVRALDWVLSVEREIIEPPPEPTSDLEISE